MERVLSAAPNQVGISRLIAAAAPYSGAFLQALPCSAVGTRIDDVTLRIAVALRLGAPVYMRPTPASVVPQSTRQACTG